MKFTKMHGIGNDYVYVDGFAETVDDPAALAPRIADRHYGVGGDGLILVLPPSANADAHVRMRMFNADGSEAEMCGNGIRCVAKYAYDHGLSDARPMRVQTAAGVKSIDYAIGNDGRLATATVDMGPPILEPAQIPVELQTVPPANRAVAVSLERLVQWPADLASDWIDTCGLDQEMTAVSMGNPHAVLFCDCTRRVPLEKIGPTLEEHPMFPERVNVHFVEVNARDEVTVRHWERGSGATLACGTGACAVCVAGVLTGRTDRRIIAHLPGGDLTLAWRQSDDHVLMTGPATEVFEGDWRD